MKSFLVLCFGLMMGLASPALVGADVSEYTVKSAYLFNFARFVDWPDNAFAKSTSPLVIGIVGDDPFGSALTEAVNGKSVGTHPLAVKRFGAYDKSLAGSLKKCQILFVSYSEKDNAREILQSLEGAPVLTVSEIEKFLPLGGMILFDQDGEKIVLDVNPNKATDAGMTISSKLLSVSKLYKGE
jgi:hypothetical protein